jgi:hypothetical protein
LSRLIFKKDFDYTATAKASYQYQKHEFKEKNISDTHYDFTENEILEGMKDSVLIYNSDLGALPWFAGRGTYWSFSLIGFSWIIRVLLVTNSKRVTFKFKKLILS